MGTIIKASGISTDENIHSSVEHAYIAAENCLTDNNIDRNEIDVVINTGVFRDYNLFEPSVAILIQRKLGISTGYSSERHVLSFDLMNGACGFLYAAQAADSIFKSTHMRKALLVSSDSHPSRQRVAEFPYAHAGAAMVLEFDETSDRGFESFQFKTDREGVAGVEAYMDTKMHGLKGRESLEIQVDENYPELLKSFAVKSIEEYLSSLHLSESELKGLMLLSNQSSDEFTKSISGSIASYKGAGEGSERKHGEIHSSSLNVAYHNAFRKGLIKENDKILFNAAGAGLTAATVLYKN